MGQQLNATNETLMNAVSMLDVPYVANVLEKNDVEELVLNTDELDCTTLVDCLISFCTGMKDRH